MKIFSSKRRVAAIGAVTALTLVGGGVAYGYWTSTGTDTGTATAGTASGFNVDVSQIAGGPMSPGGPTSTFDVTVTNPGSGVQYLDKITVSVVGTEKPLGTANSGCGAADFDVDSAGPDTPAVLTHGASLAALTGSHTFTGLTLQMVDTGSPQDACQGAIVKLQAVAS